MKRGALALLAPALAAACLRPPAPPAQPAAPAAAAPAPVAVKPSIPTHAVAGLPARFAWTSSAPLIVP
ncbi:MAG TPA: hypothetical protein VHO06_24405, partial [Polyangia bacterium]|nr:hypothetical protein [Polyangia bacterium]